MHLTPEEPLIAWLLDGDVAIQYQTYRDLLDGDRPDLRARIAVEGWGTRFLAARNANGHWGQRYYQPKWISTHYTLLDLKNLAISPTHAPIQESIRMVLRENKAPDGGILPIGQEQKSDICVNGMFLNFAAYFQAPEAALISVVDCILDQQMPDGGFNCQINRKGAHHSSLHSTISVLEGFHEYLRRGGGHRRAEMMEKAAEAREFILIHHLFRSDHTGELIKKQFLMLSYPSRWYFDILRGLDYFRAAGVPYDPRMQDALDVLKKKRRKDGRWPLQHRHPGQTHFEMEKTGRPSRWNTLRALRVLRFYDQL